MSWSVYWRLWAFRWAGRRKADSSAPLWNDNKKSNDSKKSNFNKESNCRKKGRWHKKSDCNKKISCNRQLQQQERLQRIGLINRLIALHWLSAGFSNKGKNDGPETFSLLDGGVCLVCCCAYRDGCADRR